MTRRPLVPALALALLAAALSAHAAPPLRWPHGEQAAVSLAYDDALDSQLDNALPALDRAGLHGSFYLTLANPSLTRRLDAWRAAAAHGHELGNHTLFHQCSGSAKGHAWVTPDVDLDTTSAARMEAQVRLANTMLHAIDGRTERTFTVPCGDTMAQGVNYVDPVRGEFVAVKQGSGAVIPDMAALDPGAVPVLAPEGLSGAQLIALVKAAQARGTMINFTFHGIGGDYLATSTQAHAQLLDYLAAHRDVVWTDTFLAIMKHVKAQQAAR